MEPSTPPPACDLRRIRPAATSDRVLDYLRRGVALGPTMWDGHAAFVRRTWREHAFGSGDLALLMRAEDPCTLGSARGPELGPRRAIAVGTRQRPYDFEAARELAHLLANAESEEVAVTWYEREVQLGGFVYRPRERQARRRDRTAAPPGLDARSLPAVVVGEHVIVLNPAQDFTTTFDVLLHEVAHVLLGHMGPREPVSRGTMRVPPRQLPAHHAREVEANLATALAGRRRGHAPMGIEQLFAHHFELGRASGELETVHLSWVVPAADVLAAWCRVPPDPDAVRVAADTPRIGPRIAVVG